MAAAFFISTPFPTRLCRNFLSPFQVAPAGSIPA
jgi:hypothetical protein